MSMEIIRRGMFSIQHIPTGAVLYLEPGSASASLQARITTPGITGGPYLATGSPLTVGPFTQFVTVSVEGLMGTSSIDIAMPGSTLTFTPAQQAAGATGTVATNMLGVEIGPDALPPLTAFITGLKGPLATYASTIDTTTGVALSNVKPPWLWHGTQGFVEFLSNTLIKGVGYDIGTKVYAVGTAIGDQNFWVYDKSNPGLWAKKTSAAINGGIGIFNTMFTTSTGVHLIAWAPNAGAGAQKLYRSTDEGATWTAVLTSAQLAYVNDYIGSIDEDDSGVLMCTAYNGVENTCTKGVYKSTDSGATWTNIYSAIALANDYSRHVHTVVFDPYRGAWWVSGGDGVNTAICYSTDRGVTWSAWAKSFQATVMIPTPTAFIFHADVSGYHDIHRIPADASLGVAGVVAQDPRSHVAFKLGTKRTPVAPIAGLAGDEICFNAYRDRYGILCMSIGKSPTTGKAVFLVSADDGATWTDALGGTASAQSASSTAGITIFGWEPIRPSRYAAWDGWQIGYPNATTYVSRRFRIMPSGVPLHVNPATGDDISGDGITTPLASLDHPNLPPGTRLLLDADVSSGVITLNQPGIIVDRNGHVLGAVDGGGTLTINETFEGTSSLSSTVSGTGTATQTSTANAYVDPFLPAGGTKHARLVAVAANDGAILSLANALTSVADGTIVTFKARLYITAASITAIATIMQLQGVGAVGGVNISTQTTASGGGLQLTTTSDGKIFQQHSLDLVAMPLNAYFGVKLVVFKHATRGYAKLYQITQDGPEVIMKLLVSVRDVNTTGNGWTNPRIGFISGAQAGLTMDVDNVALALGFDCDYPPAYVLAGQGQIVMPEMARS